ESPLYASVMVLAGTPSTWPTHVMPVGFGSYRSKIPNTITSGNNSKVNSGSRNIRRSDGPGRTSKLIVRKRDRRTVGSPVCGAGGTIADASVSAGAAAALTIPGPEAPYTAAAQIEATIVNRMTSEEVFTSVSDITIGRG